MGSHDESEDEQLKYAIALSLQQAGPEEQDVIPEPIRPRSRDPSFGLLLLNRKQMEEERLARLAAKRSRSTSQGDDIGDMPATKRGRKSPANRLIDKVSIPFPDGVVKRTWAKGYDRTDDDIHIDEVLQTDQLLLAMFSSFQWNEPWLLSKIDLSRTKVLLAAYAADDAQKEMMRSNAPQNIKFCFPRMQGFGNMHSKLQILKFSHYLRIVVPTGNLVPHDWGETGIMENMVFLIDLPLLNDDNRPRQMTLFQTHLQHYLQAMGIEAGMIASLSKYDFSKTADLGFVYSVPGEHSGGPKPRVGFAGLGTTIADLGLATSEPIEVDYACASLGAIKYGFVKSMYSACRGSVDKALLGIDENPYSGGNDADEALQSRQNFRIYFPSHNTIVSSRGGKISAGTICFQESWWRSSTFPKEMMRDCINTRKGLLMHSKVILVRHAGCTAHDAEKRAAWAYIGSANLSESAWGRVVRDKASGQRKIACRNWECGVVVPVRTSSEKVPATDMSIFAGRVPIPMQFPGRRYSQGEHPWFFRELGEL
ncbi:hypothetical protein E4U47_004601 [Claviceps purpurea]|nr:hypothetical protein E4U51_001824 [Claviceps purpurea]KAG6185536.1 hypothetical protein E4U36_001277 [Claviceps purpurea]KAG6260298.1 hypothetical protein E4U49_005035 [Claviceps purpurea]KAG6268511.1 hypothetical protein E4U47_004601 [Claviceps purpurea]KAG6307597.1 hypothetical protein E4U45_004044 [Claviceps purpurea]